MRDGVRKHKVKRRSTGAYGDSVLENTQINVGQLYDDVEVSRAGFQLLKVFLLPRIEHGQSNTVKIRDSLIRGQIFRINRDRTGG